MGLDIIASTIVWIFIIGSLLLIFRNKISKLLIKVKLPGWFLFLLTGTLFSIIEENINCPPTGCVLIPWTIPIFIVFLIVHLGILKIFRVKNFYLGVIIFGLIGWISEFILGANKETLWSSPLMVAVFTLWVILTYSVVVIIPVSVLLYKKKITS